MESSANPSCIHVFISEVRDFRVARVSFAERHRSLTFKIGPKLENLNFAGFAIVLLKG